MNDQEREKYVALVGEPRSDVVEIATMQSRPMEYDRAMLNRYARMVWPENDEDRKTALFRIPDKVWDHPPIKAFRECHERCIVVAAGARSYKSNLSMLRTIARTIRTPETLHLILAPTHQQVKAIYWGRLNSYIPKELIHHKSIVDLSITLTNGSMIQLMSLDRPERIEGKARVHSCLVDESGDLEENFVDRFVMGVLGEGGKLLCIGRARAGRSAHFKALADRAKKGEPGWRFFTWKSAVILPPHILAQAKEQLSPELFAQEYEATFMEVAGRAYRAFDPDVHVRELQFNPRKEILIALDFNVGVAAWTILQVLPSGAGLAVLDEVVLRDTNTHEMIVAMKEHLAAILGDKVKTWRIEAYGDYAGVQRTSNATFSNWRLVEDGFKDYNFTKHIRPSPPVINRLNVVNSLLRSGSGHVQLLVDPKCRLLIGDFTTLTYEEAFKNIQAGAEKTHSSDGVGYCAFALFGGSFGMLLS